MKQDRTVHGRMADGTPIVRYDRSGKWYAEPAAARRRQLSINEAARAAHLGTATPGLPGGTVFDRLVARLSESHVEGSERG